MDQNARMERKEQAPIIADAPWRERDLAVLWHPCTQMREHPDVLPLVAKAIATALESDGSQLRWPVGQYDEMISAARTGAGYDEFVEGMRAVLNLDW